MDKKAIGKFLKKLREEKGLTQKEKKLTQKEKKLTQIELSKKLDYIYSDALISKWERGESVPNIDDLKNLAKFFNVSVDEILNGVRYEDVDFEKKYFIYDNTWTSRYNSDDLYDIREEQELLIETRFKELLRKMVGEGLSLPEDKEFDFIVNHFYQIYLPAVECKNEEAYKNKLIEECACVEDIEYIAHDCLPGGLSDIKFEIYRQTALLHNSTVEEKLWEVNKKFVYIKQQNIWDDINNVIEGREGQVRDRLNTIEDFEKDILLASLQQINVVNTLAVGSPMGKELYEKQYGRKYDEEQLTKRTIKLLIECGAKLNKNLLGYREWIALSYKIIDELERIHKRYKAPLLVPVCENGRYHYFTVANTESNRAKLGIKYENEVFDEIDYQELERKLFKGEDTILKPYYVPVGLADEQSAYMYARRQISDMSFEEYRESRDEKATQELLKNLDNLSLKEIRSKYFPIEDRGEYIDDMRSMSLGEFKKKYFIKEVPNE